MNDVVLSAVDRITAESATPPVIIVMSDHGYNGDIALGSGTILHSLFAAYTPQELGSLAEAPTPVNLLRVLMGTFGGVDPGTLRDDRFFAAESDGDLETLTEIDDPQ